jgi:lipid A 3-O-deacylase
MNMRYPTIWLTCLFIVSGLFCRAQRIDHAPVFKAINSTGYFRLQYDNDVFTETDYYYTQGISLEYVHPEIKKWLPEKWLLKPRSSFIQYGISLNQFCYTPINTRSDIISSGDRPFAALLSFTAFLTATDSVRTDRISTAFSMGIIGPAGLGKELQTTVHRLINNPLPRGWQNQVRNDVIINYQLNYEKQLLFSPGNFLLNAATEARVGTLNDQLTAGVNLMTGHFNDPYQRSADPAKRVQYYFYGQARVHFTGYDASLQGGLFNRKSPYTISSNELTRLTFQADAGITVNFRKIYFTYSQSFLTKEFRTGLHHRWGGLSLGFAF